MRRGWRLEGASLDSATAPLKWCRSRGSQVQARKEGFQFALLLGASVRRKFCLCQLPSLQQWAAHTLWCSHSARERGSLSQARLGEQAPAELGYGREGSAPLAVQQLQRLL